MRNRSIHSRSRIPKLLLVGAALTAIVAAPLTAGAASTSNGSFSLKAQNTEDPTIKAVYGVDGSSDGAETVEPNPTAPVTDGPTAPTDGSNELRLMVNNQMPGCVAPQFSFTADPAGATIDWGDGTAAEPLNASPHSYAKPGEYKLTVKGQVKSFGPMTSGSANCFRTLDYFGENTGVTSTAGMFQGANNLSSVAAPPKSVTNYAGMFKDSRLDADISNWDTSNVRDMSSMFKGSTFRGDISRWNTSNVTDMSSMFAGAPSFNSSLNSWDMRQVAKIDHMFAGASTFNQDIGAWKLDSVTSLDSLFEGAISFNGSVAWDTSKVTSMNQTFSGAKRFNGNVSGWDTSRVTDFRRTFYETYSLSGDFSRWDVSSATDMTEMFSYNNALNNDTLANWKPAKVVHFDRMFERTIFDQDVSRWTTDAAQSWGAFADHIRDRNKLPYKFRF